jgi:hypothetical protein
MTAELCGMEAKNAARLSFVAVGGISRAIICNIPATTAGDRAIRTHSTAARASSHSVRPMAGTSTTPAPMNTPQPVVSTLVILDRSIGQCILIAFPSNAGRWREAAAQIAPCTVVPFALQNRNLGQFSHHRLSLNARVAIRDATDMVRDVECAEMRLRVDVVEA